MTSTVPRAHHRYRRRPIQLQLDDFDELTVVDEPGTDAHIAVHAPAAHRVPRSKIVDMDSGRLMSNAISWHHSR